MKKRILLSACAVLLLVALPLILGSCVIGNTGTIHVINYRSDSITSLYVYPQGSPDTHDHLSSTLYTDDYHEVIGLEPGPWTIHAVLENGAGHIEKNQTVEERTVHFVAFVNGDTVEPGP